MDTQNHFYGHSATLARYAGLRRLRHIGGLLQHGWVATSPLAVNFGDFPQVGRDGDSRKLLVWSHGSRAWRHDREERRSIAIGAPFLYALELARQNLGDALPAEEQRRPLIVPLHRTHVRRVASDPPSLARFYFDALGPSTVCLHSEDLVDVGTVAAWAEAGHEVVSAGDRFDPNFLPRLLGGILRSSRMVTNRLSTALWYAIGAGVPSSVFGPAPLIEGESRSALDRLVEIWPEVHGDNVPLEVSAPVAAGELGLAHLREPAELNSILGWDQPLSVRAAADYWTGGPVGKAMAVLNLRSRADSDASVRETTVAGGPKASDFLKHPLSHLPRTLPKLGQVGSGSDGLFPDWVRPI